MYAYLTILIDIWYCLPNFVILAHSLKTFIKPFRKTLILKRDRWSQCKNPRIVKMRSAVPPTHHPSKWALLGWLCFLCTKLGSDWRSDCDEKYWITCVKVSQQHRNVILQAYDEMSISLLKARLSKIREQDLHSAFPFHKAYHCEITNFSLESTIKMNLKLVFIFHHEIAKLLVRTLSYYIGLCMISLADLNLELPPTVRSAISF